VLLEAHPPQLPWHTYLRNASASTVSAADSADGHPATDADASPTADAFDAAIDPLLEPALGKVNPIHSEASAIHSGSPSIHSGASAIHSGSATIHSGASAVHSRRTESPADEPVTADPSHIQRAAVGFSHQAGFYLEMGHDLQPARTVRGFDACAAPCLSDAACFGFSFVSEDAIPEGEIECHWKRKGVGLVRADAGQVLP